MTGRIPGALLVNTKNASSGAWTSFFLKDLLSSDMYNFWPFLIIHKLYITFYANTILAFATKLSA